MRNQQHGLEGFVWPNPWPSPTQDTVFRTAFCSKNNAIWYSLTYLTFTQCSSSQNAQQTNKSKQIRCALFYSQVMSWNQRLTLWLSAYGTPQAPRGHWQTQERDCIPSKMETTKLMLHQHNIYSVLNGEKSEKMITLKHFETFKTLTEPNAQNWELVDLSVTCISTSFVRWSQSNSQTILDNVPSSNSAAGFVHLPVYNYAKRLY